MVYFERRNLVLDKEGLTLKPLVMDGNVVCWGVKNHKVDIAIKEFAFADYQLCEVRLKAKKYITLVTGLKEGISLTISLVGEHMGYWIGDLPKGKLANHHFSIIYAAASEGKYYFRPGSYKFVCILFQRPFFQKWRFVHNVLSVFLQNVEAGRTATICRSAVPVTGQIVFLATELFLSGKAFPDLHIHATVLELLRASFIQCTFKQVVLAKREIMEEKYRLQVREVEDFITSNLDSELSLAELASWSGLNEFKLKREFKQLYGKPIFAYWLDKRMARAKNLLQETTLHVKDIAPMVGFDLLSNFSDAFKRYFKMSPTECRDRIRIVNDRC
jgi:AraC-like DNA-binding protein